MASLSRELRVCKWACTIGYVLIVAAFVVSPWWAPGADRYTRSESYTVWITNGFVLFALGPAPHVAIPSGWHLSVLEATSRRPGSPPYPTAPLIRPTVRPPVMVARPAQDLLGGQRWGLERIRPQEGKEAPSPRQTP
jgi:hypothetical protein